MLENFNKSLLFDWFLWQICILLFFILNSFFFIVSFFILFFIIFCFLWFFLNFLFVVSFDFRKRRSLPKEGLESYTSSNNTLVHNIFVILFLIWLFEQIFNFKDMLPNNFVIIINFNETSFNTFWHIKRQDIINPNRWQLTFVFFLFSFEYFLTDCYFNVTIHIT